LLSAVPALAYAKLFSALIPGGGIDPNALRLLRALKAKKSALDFSLDDMDGIEARRCRLPNAPDPSIVGKSRSKNDYVMPQTAIRDDLIHERVGNAHAALILAAFQCDLIRVATFQWSPGTNHVSFAGLYPADPRGNYMHHPMSHLISGNVWNGQPPSDAQELAIFEFLTNVHTWYNQKTADILMDFKNAKDAFGNSVLDHTIVPFVTEIAEPNSSRQPKPSLIFGGSKLGMQGGQFLNFSTVRPQTDLFVTIAQAYLGTMTPLENLNSEVFVKTGVSVINGL
jgi:hypothetical protein